MNDWVSVAQVKRGQLVRCRLCGRQFTRKFMAYSTNYAEALRAAGEYADQHRGSEIHRAALDAFHAKDAPEPSAEQRLLAQAFDQELPTEVELRRERARGAAERKARE